MSYARNTTVPIDRTRLAIEALLRDNGADRIDNSWRAHDGKEAAAIQFEREGILVRFVMPMPPREQFELTPTGFERSKDSVDKAFNQASRSRWRALLLIIKAKFEAIESGIVSFEEEFLAHMMLPNNQSVGEHFIPQLREACFSSKMPAMPLLTNTNGDEESKA